MKYYFRLPPAYSKCMEVYLVRKFFLLWERLNTRDNLPPLFTLLIHYPHKPTITHVYA